MNQRIKQLAKEAGIWFEDSKEVRTHSVSTTTLERFAELVVQESCQAISRNHSWHDPAVNEIKQYFGVDNEQKN